MNIQSKILYLFLFAFFVYAFGIETIPKAKSLEGSYLFAKYFWLALLSFFVGFTYYCSTKENFMKSMKKIFKLYWGKQVGIDLYLGLSIFSFYIFLIEKSVVKTLIWMIPSLVFGNIIPLAYLVTHFELILSLFEG